MADKKYKLTFHLTDGTEQKVEFTAPQGEQGIQGNAGAVGAGVYYSIDDIPLGAGPQSLLPEVFSPDPGRLLRPGEIVINSVGNVGQILDWEDPTYLVEYYYSIVGHTPVKGTDYYTEEDKAEMVDLVLAALPDGDEVMY